ncbi:hypothetical protein SLS60_002289 [Paraconiothyrium brasiliense]|uniref:Major facilitator superfamily (MFS) profile domain-containing protein n=1 Tax=Paraconiothyrium brasiliense TaxID=300254 RepID=A0ABR3S2T9_9PLEO
MVARFITGIGTGIETSTVPMYQSELCEAEKRGRLVSSEPLFVGVGIEIAYWFDYGMSYTSGSKAWRLPIACQMIFAVFVIILVFGLPESPRYLYKHGRSEEALAILCDVYDATPDDPKIAKENGEILEALKVEQEHGEYKWSQLLKRDKVQTGRRVLLAYGMQFMNQMGGINLATANCIPWVYVPEILPLHVRAKGTAVGISANWIWNFFVVMITPTLLNNLEWKGYLIFMCLNFAFVPLVYFCYPETSNLTLEEIDWLFYEGNVVRRSVRISKEGWEEGVGWGSSVHGPSPAVLESGSLSSREKANVVEQNENKAG